MYQKQVIIPANTSQTAFLTNTINLNAGIISKIEIVFAWGCAAIGGTYLVGVRLSKNKSQIFPNETGTWYRANGETITFEPGKPLLKSPFELDIETYNEDDTNQHEIIVRIEIVPTWVYYRNSKAIWHDYSRGSMR